MENPLYHLIVERGFEQFQPGLTSRFKVHRLGYSYEYCELTDNPAMVIHFDTDLYLGRMATWTRGTCHLEVLECSSEQTIYDRHYNLSSEQDFHEKLAELALFLETKIKA